MPDAEVSKYVNWSKLRGYPLMCPHCYFSFQVSGYLIWRNDETVVCPQGHRFYPREGRIAYDHFPSALREW